VRLTSHLHIGSRFRIYEVLDVWAALPFFMDPHGLQRNEITRNGENYMTKSSYNATCVIKSGRKLCVGHVGRMGNQEMRTKC